MIADPDAFASRLGVRVVLHGVVDSTMSCAVADPGPAPVVHLADRQTAGRGRLGRTWASPAGNLYATIRWPETGEPFPPAVLAAVQVAWARAIRSAGGPDVRCKWPNDGLIDGKKWAGVLAARSAAHPGELHLGLGANLASAPSVDGAVTACLADVWPGGPGSFERTTILLQAALAVLEGGPAGVSEHLTDWSRYDALEPGDRIVVDDGVRSREGTYRGIDAQGRLRLEVDAREIQLGSGEARRIRRA